MKTTQKFTFRFSARKNRYGHDTAIIYAIIAIDGRRATTSTQLKIDYEKWDNRAQRMIGLSGEATFINNQLGIIRNEIFDIYNDIRYEGRSTSAQEIKDIYEGNIPEEAKNTLISLFDLFLPQLEETVGKDITYKTFTRYRAMSQKFLTYLQSKHKIEDIQLDELKLYHLLEFEHYLKTKQNLSQNQVSKYAQLFKRVIKYGIANEMMERNPFSTHHCTYEKVECGYLTTDELYKIQDKYISSARLAEIRDVFVFCCYTGYAYVDVASLTPDHLVSGIDGKKWIYTSRSKTDNRSNVPLLPPALAIIDRYQDHPYCREKGLLLPVKSNQKMNAYLKEIADLTGIKKKLTTHLARHTFATTVCLANGLSMEATSKMLDHSSIKTTQIYGRILENRVSEEMGNLEEKLFGKEKKTRKSRKK